MDIIEHFSKNYFFLFAVVMLGAIFMLAFIFTIIFMRLWRMMASRKVPHLLEQNKWALKLMLTAIVFSLMPAFFPLNPSQILFVQHIAVAVLCCALWLVLFSVTNIVVGYKEEELRSAGKHSFITILPFLRRAIKIAGSVIIFLFILHNFGVDIGALLAGLGIGGLAVALAGQKIIENLFGGMVLMLDQPVKVGDECKFEGFLGVVEDIGLQSIRIRTQERTLLTIPNGEFSRYKIENYTRRDQIRLYTTLRFHFDGTSTELQKIINDITMTLSNRADVKKDGLKIGLKELINEHRVEVELQAYIYAKKQSEFVGIRQDILLECKEIISKVKKKILKKEADYEENVV